MVHCTACGSLLKGTEGTCPVCGMPYTTPHLPAGTKLHGGKYTVGRVLGQGGFGITYQGADLSRNRPVAIKEFFPDGASRRTNALLPPTSFGVQGLEAALENFLDEARTLRRFDHPGIVDVMDVFEENFTAYLVMELLQGETLGGRIVEAGALSAQEVMDLASALSDALAVVHEAGLLHRDIKPDNVFLTQDGRTVLIDFGSARAYASGQTVSHTRLVTPGYAPLEQYTTEAKFGPYTDLYALAATLHHAATGTPPPPVTDRLAGAELAPLPDKLPPGLRAAIEQGLEIRIDERPATVAAFRALLTREARPRRRLEVPTPTPQPQVPDTRAERFDVVLRHSGFLRFLVMAEIADLTGLEPVQAMRLASEGGVISSNVSQEDAQNIKRRLEAMGAVVVVVPTGSAGDAPRTRAPTPARTGRRTRQQRPQTPSFGSGCLIGFLLLFLFFFLLSSGGFIYFF